MQVLFQENKVKLSANGRDNSQHFLPNNVGSCCVRLLMALVNVWPVSNFAKHLPTSRNNMQQVVQTDATCNIQ